MFSAFFRVAATRVTVRCVPKITAVSALRVQPLRLTVFAVRQFSAPPVRANREQKS